MSGGFYRAVRFIRRLRRLPTRDGDATYLLRLVKRYRARYGVAVIAYCPMPNHYHFLLRQGGDVPLSKFIGVLFDAYVQAVNRRQGRKRWRNVICRVSICSISAPAYLRAAFPTA